MVFSGKPPSKPGAPTSSKAASGGKSDKTAEAIAEEERAASSSSIGMDPLGIAGVPMGLRASGSLGGPLGDMDAPVGETAEETGEAEAGEEGEGRKKSASEVWLGMVDVPYFA